MRSMQLKAGDVLYREGDPSDSVYFVEDGEVEVRRGVGKDEVVLAVLSKGQILGEMGVIRDCPRSASIVATTDVSLARIEGPDFMKAFGGQDSIGLKILRMVCDRLSAVNASIGALKSAEEPQAVRQEIGEIRLLGDSPAMSQLMGNTGVLVKKLPFEIGYASPGRGRKTDGRMSLPISGKNPQLERRHFRIEVGESGQLQVRDLESRLGSIVNGKRISAFERFEEGPVAPLHPGDNEIVAGGVYSDVRFTLRLRLKAAAAA